MGSADRYQGIVVVIPTRNRPELAMNAARSVLDQRVAGIEVIVSDNSTSATDRAQLGSFCQHLADRRLRYIVPPAPLSMTRHWDWALEQALQSSGASHFVFLTDRMMFRPGSLQSIVDLVRRHPDHIISYNHDMIVDDLTPIRVMQYPWSGKVFEVSCVRLSYVYSQSCTHWSLPRMLNSVAPRSVLDVVRERFGGLFASISPDFNFGFRCLEVCDSIIVYDRSPIFHYALSRSNGASATRGEATPDSLDFAANLPVSSSERNYATPIPQLLTTGNAIMNEYYIVKQETQSSRFFEVDFGKYLARMAEELDQIMDLPARAEVERLLRAHGWAGDPVRRQRSDRLRSRVRTVLTRRFPERLLGRIRHDLRRPGTRPFWLFLARRFGVRIPDDHRFEFRTADEAIAFMCGFPRASSDRHEESRQNLEGKEVAAS